MIHQQDNFDLKDSPTIPEGFQMFTHKRNDQFYQLYWVPEQVFLGVNKRGYKWSHDGIIFFTERDIKTILNRNTVWKTINRFSWSDFKIVPCNVYVGWDDLGNGLKREYIWFDHDWSNMEDIHGYVE